MSTLTAAEAAREAARDTRGRFGVQPATESDCHLSALDRDTVRAAAIAVLSDFDPCDPGRSEATSGELLMAHSTMTRGCSPGATATEKARAVAVCIRASLVDHGGLCPADYDTVMCGVLPAKQPDVLALATAHRDVHEHLDRVRDGAALAGDHPQDGDVIDSYRVHLGIHEPADRDHQGQVNELALAWSYRLDRDVMELARHT